MEKIAKHIQAEDHNTQVLRSIKQGICNAMSEAGLGPKEAEEVLKLAMDEKLGLDLAEAAKNYTILLAAGGLGAGLLTAKLRLAMENAVNGADSPEIRANKHRIKAYNRILENYKNLEQFDKAESA